MKVTEAEFNKFWSDVFGDDENWYIEDDYESERPDDDFVDLSVGTFAYGGEMPSVVSNLIKPREIDGNQLDVSPITLFRRWQKSQTISTFVVSFEVPNTDADKSTFLEIIKNMKGKVIK